MRNILLAVVMASLPAASALAEPARNHEPDKHTSSGRLLPVKGAGTSNACAAYGPGFVKVDGTDTCMKIGGAISIGAGTSSGWR
jgi:hypothetical protein